MKTLLGRINFSTTCGIIMMLQLFLTLEDSLLLDCCTGGRGLRAVIHHTARRVLSLIPGGPFVYYLRIGAFYRVFATKVVKDLVREIWVRGPRRLATFGFEFASPFCRISGDEKYSFIDILQAQLS